MTPVKDISQDLHPMQTCEASHWLLQMKAPRHYYPESPSVKKAYPWSYFNFNQPHFRYEKKTRPDFPSCHYGSRYWQLKCTEGNSLHLLIENASEVGKFYQAWDFLEVICKVLLHLPLASAWVSLYCIACNLGFQAFVISGAWLLQFLYL